MVSVYVDNEKLDLFDDENIKVVSKSSDIENLSNVFSDYSQPFTVPATDNNNRIFKHYYNMNLDNGLNATKRQDGYLEFFSIPFKFGTIQLEGVEMKNGKPYSYKLTFYGKVTQLKETFGDDKLSQLDIPIGGTMAVYDTLSGLDWDYSADNWLSTIYDDTYLDGELFTPMIISADRDINIGGGGVYDITTNDGAIKSSETKSAIRLLRIIEGIEQKYNVTFSDDLIRSSQFSNLFLWLNQAESVLYEDVPFIPDGSFTGLNTGTRFVYETPHMTCMMRKYSYYNSPSSFIRYELTFNFQVLPESGYEDVKYTAKLLDLENKVVKEFTDVVEGDNTFSYIYISERLPDGVSNLEEIKKGMRLVLIPQSTMKVDVYSNCYYRSRFRVPLGYINTEIVNVINFTNDFLCIQYYRVHKNIPDMKVIDLIQAIMKMFKLVIKPLSDNSFKLLPIDLYYKNGNTIDITEYVDQGKMNIDLPDVYSDITFSYKKSENVQQKIFRQNTDPSDKIGYGDLSATFDIDEKKELKVELPFENMVFERLSILGTYSGGSFSNDGFSNLVIGQSTKLDDDGTFKKNKSAPIIFYKNGVVDLFDSPIKLTFNSGTYSTIAYDITHSTLISNLNDQVRTQVTDSINWGSEIDQWFGADVSKSLYSNYWENWISTIYDKKQRKVKVSARLPLNIQLDMGLDDKLIIGDNRYCINEYTTNLSTGETSFVLFKDIFQNEVLPQQISPESITANCGKRYYGIKINVGKNDTWSCTKNAVADGIDWVTLIKSSGTGTGEIVMLVDSQFSRGYPDFLDERQIDINVYINNIFVNTVRLTQLGFTLYS